MGRIALEASEFGRICQHRVGTVGQHGTKLAIYNSVGHHLRMRAVDQGRRLIKQVF